MWFGLRVGCLDAFQVYNVSKEAPVFWWIWELQGMIRGIFNTYGVIGLEVFCWRDSCEPSLSLEGSGGEFDGANWWPVWNRKKRNSEKSWKTWKPGPEIKPFETLKTSNKKHELKASRSIKHTKMNLKLKTHQLQQESLPDQSISRIVVLDFFHRWWIKFHETPVQMGIIPMTCWYLF